MSTLETIGPRAGGAPLTYEVVEAGTVTPESVFAHFDGSAASGPWRPTLTIKAQDGTILSRTFPSQELLAGDTADVTFAPFLGGEEADTTALIGNGDDLLWTSLGFASLNTDIRQYGTATAWTSGQVLATAVYLPVGRVISQLGFYQNNAGFVVTLFRVGLYDSSLNLVASTPNTTTLPQNTGWRKAAVSSVYTVTSAGVYYLAGLGVGAGLGNFGSINGNVAGQTDISRAPGTGTLPIRWIQAGQTDLPNPATANVSQETFPILFAL